LSYREETSASRSLYYRVTLISCFVVGFGRGGLGIDAIVGSLDYRTFWEVFVVTTLDLRDAVAVTAVSLRPDLSTSAILKTSNHLPVSGTATALAMLWTASSVDFVLIFHRHIGTVEDLSTWIPPLATFGGLVERPHVVAVQHAPTKRAMVLGMLRSSTPLDMPSDLASALVERESMILTELLAVAINVAT